MTAIKDLMLETFEVSKVLIIAPLRVARDTWPAEIEKWDHLKGLDISVIVGDVKTRIAAVHHPAMIYIVNRENIKWLVEYYEKNGMRWDFGMVVIDELSSFKNYQSQRFKFLRKVRPFVKRWVGLTGTPSSTEDQKEMGTFIPNTKEEQLKMLNEIGYADFDDLFKDIPAEARVQGELNLPKGKSEIEVSQIMEELASDNVVFDSISGVQARTITTYLQR